MPALARTAHLVTPAALLIAAAAAHAGIQRHDRDEAYHLALAAEPQFQAAGALLYAGFGTFASGTLIAPNWVLTAAHATDLGVPAQISFQVNGTTYSSAEFFTNPNWNGDALNGWDLSLIRLTSNVAGITPAGIYATDDMIGHEATIVGYGYGGNGAVGEIGGTLGVKRAGPNMIDTDATGIEDLLGGITLSPNNLVVDFDGPNLPDFNRTGSDIPLDREFFTGHGDSGGSWWVHDTDGAWKVGSIQSWGTINFPGENYGKYGHMSISARISDALPWIYEVTGIPAPSTTACALVFVPMLTRRRSASSR